MDVRPGVVFPSPSAYLTDRQWILGPLRPLAFAMALVSTACSNGSSERYSGLANRPNGVFEATIDLHPHALREELVQEAPRSRWGKPAISMGYLLVRASNQEVISQLEAHEPRTMASLVKIPTGLAALQNVPGLNIDEVSEMLRSSDNLSAALLVRRFAEKVANLLLPPPIIPKGLEHSSRSAHFCPPNGTADEVPAAREVLAWLKKVLPVDWGRANLVDGTGCDENNVMTPVQMVHILNYADGLGPVFAGQDFASLLTTGGGKGTLHSRLQKLDHKARVFAKTGTLHSAVTLAGYLFIPRGDTSEKFHFAVMVGIRSGKEISQARREIDSLLKVWARNSLPAQ